MRAVKDEKKNIPRYFAVAFLVDEKSGTAFVWGKSWNALVDIVFRVEDVAVTLKVVRECPFQRQLT